MFSSALLPVALLPASCFHQSFANAASAEREEEVKSILQRMEADVLSFRDEMERVYGARCETKTLTDCARNNFNDCSSSYTSQQCMKADELVISACGDGKTCNALWDKKHSRVSLPSVIAQAPLNNPSDPEVIETACYSLLAEQYMIDKYQADEQYWDRYNVQPSWTYFGAHNGLWRGIPATHQVTCGQYDARRRPWFVAASSGPKDVVLVIDTSGSMEDYGRLDIAKQAAITVIETLTLADRVAVVRFSSTATQLGRHGSSLGRATSKYKKELIMAIKGLKANGATNFYDAFDMAFDTLDMTIQSEATSGCNVAVLFMTDGEISVGPGPDEVIDLVNDRTNQLRTRYNRKTTIFTFSLGQQADHAVMKSIACSTRGIWTPVADLSGDLVAAMSSYYKLYALGLGEGENNDFTAWSEPYEFSNPAGKIGTTVAAPVYDRSVNPPLFLGVVAIDMYMDALEKVLGEDATSSTMLQRFVLLSTARCPTLKLTECELDALRFLAGGEQATCGICNSTEYVGIIPEKCPFQSDWPKNLWHNTDHEGKEYVSRACCGLGNTESDTCPAVRGQEAGQSMKTGVIIVIVAVVLFPFACLAIWKWLCSRPALLDNKEASGGARAGATAGDVTIMAPPSAPPLNPAFDARK